MPEDKTTQKYHLGNIKEWLSLAETPLRRAQSLVGEALGEHYEGRDVKSMSLMADVAVAVNSILVWTMHTQDMIGQLLEPDDKVYEPALPYRVDCLMPYYCDLCETEFQADGEVKEGDVCPDCGEGVINVAIPF